MEWGVAEELEMAERRLMKIKGPTRDETEATQS
jgi:hypothetical protein